MVDFVGQAVTAATNIGKQAVNNVEKAVSGTGLGKVLSAVGIFPGAAPFSTLYKTAEWDVKQNHDWRVKLSIPQIPEYQDSILLAPLKETGGFVFPYTPNVMIRHAANYSSVTPTHSNYPFPVYTNSSVDSITITGDFTVENSREAEYWIGAIHYLKSVTKMAYGQESSIQGAPPPVVKLNGYGDYVFKDIPVVITDFTVNLEQDVDYIEATYLTPNGSWAPTRSNIAVTLMPAYSRNKVNQFNLQKFVDGEYVYANLAEEDRGYL